MPITFMASNGNGLRKLVAVDNIMIRTVINDSSIIVGQEPETDLRKVSNCLRGFPSFVSTPLTT